MGILDRISFKKKLRWLPAWECMGRPRQDRGMSMAVTWAQGVEVVFRRAKLEVPEGPLGIYVH